MAMLAVLMAAPCAASADPLQKLKRDHEQAREARLQGRLLPLREIERRVLPRMKGADYLGFDFDSGPAIYTLKFLRNGQVIWVDVDGRSGAILGRSGR
ncbi:hypothetical protein GCM10009106_01290 [Sphingomonas japonica]